MADNGITTFVTEVEPFKSSFVIKMDDWEHCGTVFECKIELPGLAKDGITKAFPDEEKMLEKNNVSYATKVINDILEGDYLELKTEEGFIIASLISNKKPMADIYMDIEQLPFF